MRIHLFIFMMMIFAMCVSDALAQIYTCKDANGNTIYTDSPSACANAEEIKTDALPTLVPTKPLAIPASNRSTKKQDDKNTYTELVITSPANNATKRDNQGNLTINFRVAPGLKSGHKFVVTLSGKGVYTGTSTIAALKNVDRGTHSIGVKVVDAEGATKISATPVSVTLQRFSALQNNSATNGGGQNGDGNDGNNDNDDANPATNNQRLPRLPRLPRSQAN